MFPLDVEDGTWTHTRTVAIPVTLLKHGSAGWSGTMQRRPSGDAAEPTSRRTVVEAGRVWTILGEEGRSRAGYRRYYQDRWALGSEAAPDIVHG